MTNNPCCYFYFDRDGKIAYVGKANGTLEARIAAHAKEKKFQDCKCEFDIRYQEFEKASDMDMAEKVYIKSLKPYLNIVDTTTGFFPTVNLDISTLTKYDPTVKKEKKPKKKEESKSDFSPEGMFKSRLLSDLDAMYHPFLCTDAHTFGVHESFFKANYVLGNLICIFSSNRFLRLKRRVEHVRQWTLNSVDMTDIRCKGRDCIPIKFIDFLRAYVERTPAKDLMKSERDKDWVFRQFEEFRKESAIDRIG